MEKTLQHRKAAERRYRHFSLPPVTTAPALKKVEFFYIGRKSAVIESLVKSFDSGYAAESPDRARGTLHNLITRSGKVPDVIIAESSLPTESLQAFSGFLAGHEKLRYVPFFIEGSTLQPATIAGFAKTVGADDVITLSNLTKERLTAKVGFWKKVKGTAPTTESRAVELSRVVGDVLKRVLDIVISASLMVLLSPLFLLIMLALKIEAKGPVFYISKRAGRGYKIFKFYKFRTMDARANEKISDLSHLNLYSPILPDGPVFVKLGNDPRITKLGAFLRKCSLDELPQLLNVLKGDMSLVGNRPLPLYEAASLTTDRWARRFLAPAGMTGLWQIRRKNKFKMSAEDRIRLDIKYAEKSNLLFDLWILAKTPSAVIQDDNA